MGGGVFLCRNLEFLLCSLLLFFYAQKYNCKELDSVPDLKLYTLQQSSVVKNEKGNALLPATSPRSSPEPFIPLLAPSPLAPFTNSSVPRLSGLCTLNFSAAENMISIVAVDCWGFFAPLMANVICCPQLHATVAVLIGQTSKETGQLALDKTQANHCLPDIQEILTAQGANGSLSQICSIRPSNLTEASCPVKYVNEFESMIDMSRLLAACERVDGVTECCSQICQNEIAEVATKLALKDEGVAGMGGPGASVDRLAKVDDCKQIVLRWLASRLEPLMAKQVLRRISNCNLNKACPLVFPDTRNVAKYCQNEIENQTACCNAMGSYISHLQKQSFITNLQALDCAALLGAKLKKVDIMKNVFGLCHVSLKDFSLQVGLQESGCLLPSLPSDATLQSTGISFTCDLNDNIAAPWPSDSSHPSISSCNKTIRLPALPAATSASNDPDSKFMGLHLLSASMIILVPLLKF
ncbi:uncharacterized GPI-anchored protein At1g61900-like [Aristolochia californica]|uniref:uncharacterized GPI-anchored protein At1g61900-like n=1 Tax=Aristolochia californica TaxID=171875 RepID=UPI0035D65EE0